MPKAEIVLEICRKELWKEGDKLCLTISFHSFNQFILGVLNEDFGELLFSILFLQFLKPTLDIEILSQMGCGESFEGVAVGADMYHQQHVKAFIGPYCNAGSREGKPL